MTAAELIGRYDGPLGRRHVIFDSVLFAFSVVAATFLPTEVAASTPKPDKLHLDDTEPMPQMLELSIADLQALDKTIKTTRTKLGSESPLDRQKTITGEGQKFDILNLNGFAIAVRRTVPERVAVPDHSGSTVYASRKANGGPNPQNAVQYYVDVQGENIAALPLIVPLPPLYDDTGVLISKLEKVFIEPRRPGAPGVRFAKHYAPSPDVFMFRGENPIAVSRVIPLDPQATSRVRLKVNSQDETVGYDREVLTVVTNRQSKRSVPTWVSDGYPVYVISPDMVKTKHNRAQ